MLVRLVFRAEKRTTVLRAMSDPDGSATSRLPWPWFAAPLFVGAAARGLWAPDEPRYAMIARWIYESGDFLVLRRCGELYADKPPFVYWIAGALGFVTGWSELAMRLVSIAAFVATAWMTRSFAKRWWGDGEASWAPILFLGFALVFWNGGRLGLDPTLTLGCTGALWLASADAATEREASRQTLLAGAFGGVAMLAKGPVALVAIGLPLLAWRALKLRAAGPRASRSAFWAAVALTVLPVTSWAILAALREPALWRPLFFGQHLERAAEGTHHSGPPWEHLLEMPLYLLPWTPLVILGAASGFRAVRAQRRGGELDRGLAMAWLWLATLFVFFSAIKAKREVYLLPAYPACALLAARTLASSLRAGRVARWVALAPAALLALVALGLLALRPIAAKAGLDEPELGWRGAAAGIPFAVGAVLSLRAHLRERQTAWARGIAATWGVGLVVALLAVVPVFDEVKSDRALARKLALLPQKPREIPCYGTAADGVRFYGGGPCVQARNAGLTDGDLAARLEREGDEFVGLVEAEGWEEKVAPSLRERFRVLWRERVGSRSIYVLGCRR
jgi:4-amino-4-deoxy-L-arabinose transferase-like glycosyltransferase